MIKNAFYMYFLLLEINVFLSDRRFVNCSFETIYFKVMKVVSLMHCGSCILMLKY